MLFAIVAFIARDVLECPIFSAKPLGEWVITSHIGFHKVAQGEISEKPQANGA